MAKGHFEAKKHAFRQTQEGVVISFVVHPNDVTAAIAMAPLGTRFMVGFAEIGDDEKPAEKSAEKPERPKREFSKLGFPEQAGIRCQDQAFHMFLMAAGYAKPDDHDAAEVVRKHCGVTSRSMLSRENVGGRRWEDLNQKFERWQTDQRYGDMKR